MPRTSSFYLTLLIRVFHRKWNYPPRICELFISLAPVDLKDVKNFSMRNADLFKASKINIGFKSDLPLISLLLRWIRQHG